MPSLFASGRDWKGDSASLRGLAGGRRGERGVSVGSSEGEVFHRVDDADAIDTTVGRCLRRSSVVDDSGVTGACGAALEMSGVKLRAYGLALIALPPPPPPPRPSGRDRLITLGPGWRGGWGGYCKNGPNVEARDGSCGSCGECRDDEVAAPALGTDESGRTLRDSDDVERTVRGADEGPTELRPDA